MAVINILSYRERGIRLDSVNPGAPINIFEKKGIPVSFKIEMDTQYISRKPKVEFLIKDQAFINSNISKNKEIINLVNELKEKFFSTDSKIFCFFENGKLYMYDAYTNTNFFPYSDLKRITDEFDYASVGLNLMIPIFSGYKTSSEALDFVNSYIKSNSGKSLKDLFIMPMYPIFSSATYFFNDEIKTDTLEEKETELFEEKVSVKAEVQDVPTLVEYEEDKLDEVCDFLKNEYKEDEKKAKAKKENDYLLNLINDIKEEEKSKRKMKDIFLPDFKRNEYKGTLTNIESCLITFKVELNENEKRLVDVVAMLWHSWSNVGYMNVVQDFIEAEYGPVKGKLAKQIVEKPATSLSYVFLSIWELYEETLLEEKILKEDRDFFTSAFLYKTLQNEFYFYIQALSTKFRTEYY